MQVRTVEDPRELATVAGVLAEIWATPPGSPPLPADVLRGFAHAGGAVHVAYEGDRPVGAAAAVFGPPASRSVYSLIAGTLTSDRGIGSALKLSQRAWALERGATVMRWTFDPLVGRNARFNLTKLGAIAHEYSVDFYGQLDDGVNVEAETDRLTAEWHLDVDPPAGTEPAGPPTDATVTAEGPDGEPLAVTAANVVWCRVPSDILTLRRHDPPAADAWRRAVRAVLVPAFDGGLVATGMTRDGWYRLTPEERP